MNPFGEAERARKRESLLKATEADLEKITAACARARAPLRGEDKIALRVGKVLNRRKVAKHFTIDIGEDRFSYHRNQDCIAAEAKLDGIYVLRTSVEAGDLDSPEVVSSYMPTGPSAWRRWGIANESESRRQWPRSVRDKCPLRSSYAGVPLTLCTRTRQASLGLSPRDCVWSPRPGMRLTLRRPG